MFRSGSEPAIPCACGAILLWFVKCLKLTRHVYGRARLMLDVSGQPVYPAPLQEPQSRGVLHGRLTPVRRYPTQWRLESDAVAETLRFYFFRMRLLNLWHIFLISLMRPTYSVYPKFLRLLLFNPSNKFQ
jgi:hypothetical protein